MTAQDLIYQALRKCGQLRPGYLSNSDLLSDALTEFQAMYDNWNAERTMSYSIPDYIYDVSTTDGLNGIYGQNVQFSIGPSFTFTGTTTISTDSITTTNTQGLVIGQPISGTGIPAGAYITAIVTNTSITMSDDATASGSVTITVSPIFSGPRPEAIIRMNLYMTSTSPTSPTRIPLAPISAEQWANIAVLQITPVTVTTVFYYDPQYPQGIINVWPPLNGNSLEIFTWGFLTPPTVLSAVMLIPPGYQDAIVWTLAQRLYPLATRNVFTNKVPLQYLAGQAALARAKVKAVNAPSPKLVNDFTGGRAQRAARANNWETLLTGIPY